MGSEGSGNVVGDQTPTSLSPKSKFKFLCSYGGKILPSPTDGILKYVGGETRVIAMPRDHIKFSDLMKKLTPLFDGVLKYQLVPEDLHVLISVRSDEDLKHMLDEYDRLETEATPKLRCFLFPSNPIVVDTQPFSADPLSIEHRYLDAINGIVRSTSNANCPTFSISSPCSSPKSCSPDAHETFSWNNGIKLNNYPPPMHKVHSSPTLCTFNNLQPSPNLIPPPVSSKHHIHQSHYQNHPPIPIQHHHHNNNYHSSRLPREFIRSNTPERVPMAHSSSPPIPRINVGRSPMGPCVTHQTSSSRQQRGVVGWNKYGFSDEFGVNGCGRIDKTESDQWSSRNAPWE